ncbi:chromate efflux transporter [Ferrimonas gelatinilytica]|uniref:Chromate efflux transporter n=1 Tax=Ferrimonas gelatinilytica TaxID=1255257 RepID=A0ABP9S7M5_9GAMM
MGQNLVKAMRLFIRFLLLGCVSFGGPAAHLGYYHKEFVEKSRWLGESEFARMVALSQFLPGPGSSQVCCAIGYRRAGLVGAMAAFLGFTLPSFLLMSMLAQASADRMALGVVPLVIQGLKLLAVVVVADAVWGMAERFCRSALHWGLACGSAMALMLFPGLWIQCLVLVVAALIAGCLSCERENTASTVAYRWPKKVPMMLFVAALLLVLWPTEGHVLGIFSDFFQAGSLVFGGGHVVLPLLQHTVGESMDPDRFLTGYAAAQGLPGPVFTLAAFLGVELMPEHPWLGALVATLGIFLPGLLLMLALLPCWEGLASRPRLGAAAAGINAAVVGLLFSALYQPVFVSAVLSARDMALVVLGLFLLRGRQWPVLAVLMTMVGLHLWIPGAH